MSSSLSGQRLGNFEIGALVGSGGMGEVYRARDTRLNRDVAIKVLLPSVAGDSERLARFNREAQVLASLNHPNIAHIHGVEQGLQGPLLVLEFVGGPTLADRIAAGPLPIDEAIAIARQITDALEAAHERGVIHRDLKPANVKVDDNGTVKVLDFGLAKALDPLAADPGAAVNSPTITSPAMTLAGLIIGTAAYMSPEQAKGRVVDKRSDVWAFGCVFYEMLTGKRAFEGEDVTDTIAAVVRGDPDWNALPAETPDHIRLLLKRCLEKDRRKRIGDISVVRFVLDERIESAPLDSANTKATELPRKAYLFAAAAFLLGTLITFAIGWSVWPQPPPARTTRFTFTTGSVQSQGNDRDIAIARDGSFMVYRATTVAGPSQLVVHNFSEADSHALATTSGARSPAISSDGKWVAFGSGGELRKVPIAGGPPTVICKLRGGLRGIAWADDDTIVFATSQVPGLQRITAAGGEPQSITKPQDGFFHRAPFMMPGSTAVLFTATAAAASASNVMVLDLKNGTEKTIVDGGQEAVYLDDGFLVYASAVSTGDVRHSLLRAARFDPDRLEVEGEAVTMSDQIELGPTGISNFAISGRGGDLVFLPSTALPPTGARRTMVWVDRNGREVPLGAQPHAYATARISPDGTRVAVDMREQTNDIWVWDLGRRTLTPVNRDPSQDQAPIWLTDGKRIVWSSPRISPVPSLFWQAADGTGQAERLSTSEGNLFPTSMTSDGRYIIAFGTNGVQLTDIFRIDVRDSNRKPETLVSGPSLEFGGEVSPDGRWLAYHSNEAGEQQVFVRPFPNVQDRRVQVSTGGGTRPVWSRRGDELFYLDLNGLLTAVPVIEGKEFVVGAPGTILKTAYYLGSTALGLDLRGYDVSPDGKRFLMIKEESGAGGPVQETEIVIALNWVEELRARLSQR